MSKKQNSPLVTEESGTSKNAGSPLDASRDYILFSPTRLAAAMKRAKLQQSLQNGSLSVLTVLSGLELSTLNDTTPQPGDYFSIAVKPGIKQNSYFYILFHIV